jgi:hypothetical protein
MDLRIILFCSLLALAGILTVYLGYLQMSAPDKLYDCYVHIQNLEIPTNCEYAKSIKDKGIVSKLILPTSTLPGAAERYICPDCPPLQDCLSYQALYSSTSSSTTLITLPPAAYGSILGPEYCTAKEVKIDFKYKMCNPHEDVYIPIYSEINPRDNNITNCTSFLDKHNITLLNCTTYDIERLDCRQITNTSKLNCTEYFNGTKQTISYTIQNETKKIKGGCIAVPTSVCSCKDGSQIDAINAKYYRQYYNESFNKCETIVCPGVMRSAIGCTPSVSCLDGVCKIVNR